MVASNTLELPYYKGIGRQRGRVFGALAQVIGRAPILFLKKYIVPAVKRVGADLLEFAVSEVTDVVSGKKNFKTAAKSVGRQTFRKQLGGGRQKKSFPVKKLKRSSRSGRDVFSKVANTSANLRATKFKKKPKFSSKSNSCRQPIRIEYHSAEKNPNALG